MSALPRLILLVAAGLSAGPLSAATNTGYRCTGANGAIAFQDKPCGGGQQSRSFEYEREPPPAETAPEPVAEPRDETVLRGPDLRAMPAPPPPRPPAPTVYQCVRADNDKIYFSDTGETAPYLVPAGVVGLPGSSLAANAQASAPEINRTPIAAPGGASAIAGAYVEVRDRCQKLVPAEACRALRAQLDDNLSRQRSASKDERAGLAGQARTLADKLAGC